MALRGKKRTDTKGIEEKNLYSKILGNNLKMSPLTNLGSQATKALHFPDPSSSAGAATARRVPPSLGPASSCVAQRSRTPGCGAQEL